jgi:hypothetical protein
LNIEEARALLSAGDGVEDPVFLPPSILDSLTVDDFPPNTFVEIGALKDGIMHIEWSGRLYCENGCFVGEADHTWTRKYWYEPIGLQQYLDLVKRGVEVRQKNYGDVKLTYFEDDGAFIQLSFAVLTGEKNLGRAYDVVRRISSELEEASDQLSAEVGVQIAAIAARVSGWGASSLEVLVQTIDEATTPDDKGRSLEELCSRLFESVNGLTVTNRIRTATEEIDLSILNDNDDPRLRRESALLLAECKNWMRKCGKDEFVIFREKLENRNQRCNLGFLISWNGFATTVTKEMLRGSREETLIVPITGRDLRTAVRDGDFLKVLVECWEAAVHL